MLQHAPAETPALALRQDGNILDKQMIATVYGFDEGDDALPSEHQIDDVLANRTVEISGHWFGLAPDQRHPLLISQARELAHDHRVCRHGTPQLGIRAA